MSLPIMRRDDMDATRGASNTIQFTTDCHDAHEAVSNTHTLCANIPLDAGSVHMPARNQRAKPILPIRPRPESIANESFLPQDQVTDQYRPSRDPQACLACGRHRCTLRSHQAFTRRNLMPLLPRREGRKSTVQSPAQPTIFSAKRKTGFRMSLQIENPRIDPFGKFPIPTVPDDHRLLDLWTQQWPGTHHGASRHLFPVPTVNLMYQHIMKSPALFRAFLSIAATQASLGRGKIDAAAFRQQADAVKLHSAACVDEKTASSDENILTALCIMSNYLAHGNASEVYKYTEGINSMVKLRGGPHYLGMNGAVAGYLMYADHAQAIWHDREPMWKMPLPSLKFPGMPTHRPKLGTGFTLLKGHLDPPVLELADDICRLTGLFDAGLKKNVSSQALGAVGYLNMVCEYQMAELAYRYSGYISRTTCVCLALLIFDHVILQNDGAVNPGLRRMEQRLWHNLKESRSQNLWADDAYVRLLIWILFTGLSITTTAKSPWYDYGIEQIRTASVRAGLRSFNEVQSQVLEPFCWLDVAQESTFRKIWRETEKSESGVKKGQVPDRLHSVAGIRS